MLVLVLNVLTQIVLNAQMTHHAQLVELDLNGMELNVKIVLYLIVLKGALKYSISQALDANNVRIIWQIAKFVIFQEIFYNVKHVKDKHTIPQMENHVIHHKELHVGQSNLCMEPIVFHVVQQYLIALNVHLIVIVICNALNALVAIN